MPPLQINQSKNKWRAQDNISPIVLVQCVDESTSYERSKLPNLLTFFYFYTILKENYIQGHTVLTVVQQSNHAIWIHVDTHIEL